MEPFTAEGLARRDKKKKREEAKEKGELSDEEEEEEDVYQKYPKEYYMYKTRGVVIHMGTADSGHYYSLVKDPEDEQSTSEQAQWYECNDSMVREFNVKELAEEAFGGEEKWEGHMNYPSGSAGNSWSREKICNAYMVFYERIDKNYEPPIENEEGEVIKPKEEVEEVEMMSSDIEQPQLLRKDTIAQPPNEIHEMIL